MDNDNPAITGVISQQQWDTTEFILNMRFADAIEQGAKKYPIYRDLRFAARTELESLFDDLALDSQWQAVRIDSRSLLLESDQAIISCRGSRKSSYCSCYFSIWGSSIEIVDQIRDSILQRVENSVIQEPMFSINWHFLTSKQELQNANIEELADDVLLDTAYPDIEQGVKTFIEQYIAADETVLVLQGPPGTGKTRLIRAILGELSRQKKGNASALYTGDQKTLESDEIFVRFITGWEDAFVVEDADHLLKPRAEGNENLHRFLTIADGVVRSQGRKIIFSTNLPNVGDLDDALVRPGRCFARLNVRELSFVEAQALVEVLCGDKDPDTAKRAIDILHERRNKTYSLAEIYKTLGDLA